MRRNIPLWLVLLTGFASGCQCIQQMEQWKCDNLGLCHCVQPRPGVYQPMALPPSYGVPPAGLAPVGLPTATYPNAAGTFPAVSIGAPPAAAAPVYGNPTFAPPPSGVPIYGPTNATGSPYAAQGTGVPKNNNCQNCQQ